MYIFDKDVYRAAKLLIDQNGEEAAIMASKRADQCLAEGDRDGQRLWMQIVKAVLELKNTTKPDRLN